MGRFDTITIHTTHVLDRERLIRALTYVGRDPAYHTDEPPAPTPAEVRQAVAEVIAVNGDPSFWAIDPLDLRQVLIQNWAIDTADRVFPELLAEQETGELT